MKKYLAILVFPITMVLFYSDPSYPSGVITHIGQAQEIINMAKMPNSGIPSDIASIITKSPETERAFRSGALDSDIFNALIDKYKLDPYELNRRTHEKCSVLIASILLKNAKTDIDYWGQVLQSYISFDRVNAWRDLYGLNFQELSIMSPPGAMPSRLFS